MELNIIDSLNTVGMIEKRQIARFLHDHLDEYSDSMDNILKALDYALQETSVDGGFLITAKEDEQLVGAVVYNRTGMEGYIPPNLLVYLAVHKDYRKRGIGSKLLQKSLEIAKGDIKVLVRKDSPASGLCEKFGFSIEHTEFRLKR